MGLDDIAKKIDETTKVDVPLTAEPPRMLVVDVDRLKTIEDIKKVLGLMVYKGSAELAMHYDIEDFMISESHYTLKQNLKKAPHLTAQSAMREQFGIDEHGNPLCRKCKNNTFRMGRCLACNTHS